ncbi:MAG: MBL fold metallo-hydrolase [Acidimicrobiales bacterium]
MTLADDPLGFSPAELARAHRLFEHGPARPPEPDEFDLTLLGPNFGESAVVHVGHGRWIVVDSCRHRKLNLALAYLRHLGLDPADVVERVVVSHWHKDHVDGLSALLRACPKALLVAPSAVNVAEVYRMAFDRAAHLRRDSRFKKRRPAVVEFTEAMTIAKERHALGQEAVIWAGAHTTVLHAPEIDVFVGAWSPSGHAQSECVERLGDLCTLLATDDPDVPPPINPNMLSIVLSVHAGDRQAILGADLERSASPTKGWASVKSVSGVHLASGTELLKVPHHGSVTAEDPALWALCGSSSRGVVAPCRRGRVLLPDPDDILRLLEHVAEISCTALPMVPRKGREVVHPSELGAVTLRARRYGTARWKHFLAPRAIHRVRTVRR